MFWVVNHYQFETKQKNINLNHDRIKPQDPHRILYPIYVLYIFVVYLQRLVYLAQGGIGFYIALTEALPEEVKEGVAHFQGVADVTVEKTNPFMLAGTIPRK